MSASAFGSISAQRPVGFHQGVQVAGDAGEDEDVKPQLVELLLAVGGPFVTPAGELLREHPEKIPLLGVQREAAFDDGIVEHAGPVARRQQDRRVFLAVRPFAVDEGRDQRERGEWLPVGRGIVSQENSPCLSIR
jgi:hypothetical protein